MFVRERTEGQLTSEDIDPKPDPRIFLDAGNAQGAFNSRWITIEPQVMQRSSEMYPDGSRSVPGDYSCVLCGAGPAGMGFLFYAFKSGKLAEVARNGLLIIDKRMSLGAGKLGDYVNVTGNSVSKTFLACLEHERFDEVFGDIREYNELHRNWLRIRTVRRCSPRLANCLRWQPSGLSLTSSSITTSTYYAATKSMRSGAAETVVSKSPITTRANQRHAAW